VRASSEYERRPLKCTVYAPAVRGDCTAPRASGAPVRSAGLYPGRRRNPSSVQYRAASVGRRALGYRACLAARPAEVVEIVPRARLGRPPRAAFRVEPSTEKETGATGLEPATSGVIDRLAALSSPSQRRLFGMVKPNSEHWQCAAGPPGGRAGCQEIANVDTQAGAAGVVEPLSGRRLRDAVEELVLKYERR